MSIRMFAKDSGSLACHVGPFRLFNASLQDGTVNKIPTSANEVSQHRVHAAALYDGSTQSQSGTA